MKLYYLEKDTPDGKMYWNGKHKWSKKKSPRIFKTLAALKTYLTVTCGTRPDYRKGFDYLKKARTSAQCIERNWDVISPDCDPRNAQIKGFEVDLDNVNITFNENTDIHIGLVPEHIAQWKQKLGEMNE